MVRGIHSDPVVSIYPLKDIGVYNIGVVAHYIIEDGKRY